MTQNISEIIVAASQSPMEPLSMELQAALGGQGEMTPKLLWEWQVKRPDEYRAHWKRAIDKAMEGLYEEKTVILPQSEGAVL